MARPLAAFRGTQLNRQEKRDLSLGTKPVLVAALREVQAVCPPRVSQQSKADLERIVRGALWRDDNDPIRDKMRAALAAARAAA